MDNLKNAFAKVRESEGYWSSRVKLSLATQLQDLIKQAGLTQDRYAQELGVKPSQVSRALNGMSNPTIDTVVKMAFALGYVPSVSFVAKDAKAATAEQCDIAFDQADVGPELLVSEVKPQAKLYNFAAAARSRVPLRQPTTFTCTDSRDVKFGS